MKDDELEDAVDNANEDIPTDSPSAKKAPELKRIPDEDPQKRKKDGVDKALEMLDEYMEGVPPRDPRWPHDDDDHAK